MDEREKRFYEELGRTPPPPAELYEAIERRIGAAKRLRAGVVAAAAALLAAFGAMTFLSPERETPARSAGVDSVVVEELDNVAAYLHGTAIDSEIGMYAFVDWDEIGVSAKEADR
jgi:hypothetical protein